MDGLSTAEPPPQAQVPMTEASAAADDANAQAQAWADMSVMQPQLDPTQLALLQQQQQPSTLTPEQLAALTGALGGNDLSALSGALGGNEILQRLMVAPAEAPAADQPAMNIQLPRAPDLVSTSFMLDGSTAAVDPAAVPAPDALQTGLTAAAPGLGDAAAAGVAGPQLGAEPTPDAVAAAVAAAAAATAAGGGAADVSTAALPAELQLQLQRGAKRKAGDAMDPPADSDVADILLAMAGNPALKKLQAQNKAAAGAAGIAGLAGLDGTGLGAAGMPGTVHEGAAAAAGDAGGPGMEGVLQPGLPNADAAAAAAAAAAAGNTTTIIDQNGQQVVVSMAGGQLTDAAGNVLDLSGLTAGLGAVSAGYPGLPVGMQGLGATGMLQIADLSRLPQLSAANGMQGYAALPGMQGLQLVQLQPGDLSALQQAGYALGGEQGRPLKRARGEGDSADGTGGMEEDAAGVGDAGMMDAAAAAAAAGGMSGISEQQLAELQQQAADANAAAAAAATALGTVVNVNGVNMLIPAAPQLQLQLASDGNMQDQLLTLQQQVQLGHIPVMSGIGGLQLPAGMANLAGASPEQMQQLQQQIQIQQQIQQLQLQQQLQIMQLQLASQQGIVIAGPGGRGFMEGDGSGHMVRRHGVLPERMVTRDMLKQVFHLPIEEAAKHLGIGQTMLKHYCRKFGIPRWPYRKRQSVVQLITSIEDYAQTQDKPMVVEPALVKLRSFLSQIDEDPNIDLDAPIKRLRQAFFKEAYKQRVRKQQSESGEERGGRGGRGVGRTEAWLENLCQAIVDNHPEHPGGGGDAGGGLGDMDDEYKDYKDEMDDGGAGDEMGDEMQQQHHHHHHAAAAAAAAAAEHAAHQAAAAAAGLDPNAVAMSMAAVAQLAGVGGGGMGGGHDGGPDEGLGGGQGGGHHGMIEDPTALVAAAQAQAQAEHVAALEAAAAAAAHGQGQD